MITIKKGLNLPLEGKPEQRIESARRSRHVALLGDDYPGLRPTMAVQEGSRVRRGQLLFTCKKTPGLRYTAPAAGVVTHINRGARRSLISVVIAVQGDEAETFERLQSADDAVSLTRAEVVENLLQSGLWTALRTRPFSKPPAATAPAPRSLFVTAIDTNPLAPDPARVIGERTAAFALGLDLLAKLTDGPLFLCTGTGDAAAAIPEGSDSRIQVQRFAGIHPAGLAGTHIHFLDPVSESRRVWYINYQDVIATGELFLRGELVSERVVALAGPGVRQPRLLRTILGADLPELAAGELLGGEFRIVSGSVLAGRRAVGPWGYLGRYHHQVSVIREDRSRRFLGWLTSGFNHHSVLPIYVSRWLGRQNLELTTSTNGSPRAMVPVGSYERVMPLDVLPTQLLRSLVTGDIELAQLLGCLELDEEDIALCTYACPAKYEYGPVLRQMLDRIEAEG